MPEIIGYEEEKQIIDACRFGEYIDTSDVSPELSQLLLRTMKQWLADQPVAD